PYILSDALMHGLLYLFPVYAAGKMFAALAFLSVAAGVLLLAKRLHGSIPAATLMLWPLLYNQPLVWGMLNFLLGIGVALCSYALWLVMRSRRLRWVWLFVLLNL